MSRDIVDTFRDPPALVHGLSARRIEVPEGVGLAVLNFPLLAARFRPLVDTEVLISLL
jgi:hypothetical protein